MLYVTIFILFFAFSLNEKYSDKLFKLSVIILIFITCFRAKSVGIDTSGGYYSYYHAVLNGNTLSFMEYSWVLINKISILLGWGYQGVIVISGLLTILPVAYVINNSNINKCLGVAFYYGQYLVLYSFNMMRQCIAISFVLLSVHLLIRKKYPLTIASFAFACIIHNSALFSIVIFPFFKLKINFKRIALLFIGSFAVGLVMNQSLFIKISGQYGSYLDNNNGYSGFRSSFMQAALLSVVVTLFFLFIIYFEFDKVKNNKWLYVSVLGIMIMNITMKLGQGTRLVQYFSQAQILFMPQYLKKIENKYNKYGIFVMYFAYLLTNFYRILSSQLDSLIPYKFFWELK